MGDFFLLTLLSWAKWLAVPPIIITQISHSLIIQSFNLFDNIIIIYIFPFSFLTFLSD